MTAAVSAVAAGGATVRDGGWSAAVTMVTAAVATLTAVGWWLRSVPRLTGSAVIAAVCSGAGTALSLRGEPIGENSPAAPLMSVEFITLVGLTFVVTRFVPLRRAIPLWLLLGAAASTVLLRVQGFDSLLEAVGQAAFLSLGVMAAGGVGAYLQWMDEQRMNSVRAARRAQRIELARDLHDFVAHDVSGIVVLAQAVQVVCAQQPEQVLPLLRQIESAGQQALRSMDRTVHMLHHADDPATDRTGRSSDDRPSSYGLSDIPDLVERFRSSGPARVGLDLDLTVELAAQVPREVAATAHRVIVEGLTNIRRHARTAADVQVAVRPETGGPVPELAITVTNAAQAIVATGPLHDGDRRGGLGLVGLTERVEALGGTLTAGPYGAGGWQLRAALPIGAPAQGDGRPAETEEPGVIRGVAG
ncbi:histidine kinase [Streptomyces sp. NPDC026206]|uniref:sensor histidine kinase n=1 Tax=Streptomyces sp. NPDC026206 TaxID=3157089 RepID=UPI0033DAE7BE